MTLDSSHLAELEGLAITAATRAGEMIREKAQHSHPVDHKEGGSSLASQVVTAVDLESQRLILETLEESLSRFDLGLLTEESPDDASRHRHDHFWCIDPMDGTLAFTRGEPGYAVSIALVSREGKSRLGVVFDPSTSTLYHAVDQGGARKNGETWTLDPNPPKDLLTLLIDNSFIPRVRDPAYRAQLDALASRAGYRGLRVIDHAGSVLNACGVAEQAPAVYFKLPKSEPGGGSLWDFAATTCLFQELGLPSGALDGNPLPLNPKGDTFMNRHGVLFASDPEIAAAVSQLPP